jgi:site-specific DNA-methyltransferase (adenine-specific)
VTPYYEDGLVTIYHGDCREWMPEADVVVTDPPYGIGWNAVSISRQTNRPIFGDDVPFDPAFLLALGKPTVLFGANHYASRLPDCAGWIVWDKRDGQTPTDQSDAELAWCNFGGTVRTIRVPLRGGGSRAIDHPAGLPVSMHPTQKPLRLMSQVIERCPPGTVLDPFAGSGSTLVAAKGLGRRAIGIEIEERYCEVAATRCSQEVLGLGA